VIALVRFESATGPQFGILEQDKVTPSGLGDEAWAAQLENWASGATSPAGSSLPADEIELLPPLIGSSRIFCVAQNYPAHAAEAGGASPPKPIVFYKPPSAFVGHNRTITIPMASRFYDYEGEIAVVIGKTGTAIPAETAAEYVAGYTTANDGSARDLQPATLADRFQVDWFAAKSFENGSAMGPGIVPASALPEPEKTQLRTWHNGELVQKDTAHSMFHSIPDLISFISQIVTLRPADVILTGTPAGVGKARGIALTGGDRVTVSATGLPTLTNKYEPAQEPKQWTN
jgi:2-keto-4-pentenoate hydratase/2-oxohepta-3-ene-1,7-dioic acid hydratase in catechol pathway